MTQFQVVKCFQCSMFQVKQVTKAKKWCCKLCNAKQSLQKVYHEGSAPECRQATQQWNLQSSLRLASSVAMHCAVAINPCPDPSCHLTNQKVGCEDLLPKAFVSSGSSVWTKYLDEPIEEETAHEVPETIVQSANRQRSALDETATTSYQSAELKTVFTESTNKKRKTFSADSDSHDSYYENVESHNVMHLSTENIFKAPAANKITRLTNRKRETIVQGSEDFSPKVAKPVAEKERPKNAVSENSKWAAFL